MLEQKVGIIAQQKWVTKLMGYNFKIEFKKKRENKMADALSRKYERGEMEEWVLAIISFPTLDWMEELKLSYSSSPELLEFLTKFQAKKEVPNGYTL